MQNYVIVHSPLDRGFIIEFSKFILLIDPPMTNSTLSLLANTEKYVEVILSEAKNADTIAKLCDMCRVVIPSESSSRYSKAESYHEEEAIVFTESLLGYYLNPPMITEYSPNSRFILLITQPLVILYVPRVTLIEKPPKIDLALTYEQTLKDAISKSIASSTSITRYLGCDPQLCLVKSAEDSVASNIVYLNKKKYRISRHLSEIILGEVDTIQSGARSSQNQSRSEIIT